VAWFGVKRSKVNVIVRARVNSNTAWVRTLCIECLLVVVVVIIITIIIIVNLYYYY